MIRYGSKIKSMIKESGLTLKEISEKMDIPASTISSWYKSEYPPLEAIIKLCEFFGISVAEFFWDDSGELKKELPYYITKSDADILKILNTSIDPKTRIEIKHIFAGMLKIALLQHSDKIKHSPEFKELFKDGIYKNEEVNSSSLHDEDKMKK